MANAFTIPQRSINGEEILHRYYCIIDMCHLLFNILLYFCSLLYNCVCRVLCIITDFTVQSVLGLLIKFKRIS